MKIYEELQARGLLAQLTDAEEIRDLINNGKATFYIGFDPTADSLHVGHFMALCLMKRLQMAGNKPIALIIPGLAGIYNIFLIRQFMMAIPDVILESARIDGANEFRIYRQIVLPSCKPILVAVGLFTFTGSWNDFLWPSIAINNLDRLTLTAGLQLAKGVYGNKVPQMSAIATIAIVPMIILYLFTQKYFVKGISLSSGVKG